MTSTIQNVEGVEAIKACPFCRGTNLRRPMQDAWQKWLVGCEDCGAEGPQADSPEEAVIAWSTRQSLAREPATADVEREVVAAVRRLERKAVPEMGTSTICDRADLRTVLAALSRAAPSSEPAIAEGERIKGDDWCDDWKRNGYNHAITQAQKALRFLAENDRPIGGEQFPNSASCHMIADELETTRQRYAALAQSSTPPASKGVEVPAGWQIVPIKPTEEMFQASSLFWRDEWQKNWSAILAAAPTPSNDTLQGLGDDSFEQAWRELHGKLNWMQGHPALKRYLGRNFADTANDLIDRAYPGLRAQAVKPPTDK